MIIDLKPHVAAIARHVLGPENKERSSRTELRFGNHGSLSVVIADGKWFDHENQIGGGLFDLIRDRVGIAGNELAEWLRRELSIDTGGPGNRTASGKRIATTHDYRDERGELLFQVVRFEPKDFRQRRQDGKGDWIWSTKGIRQVPYRLPELLAAVADVPVFIVEGEKDADNLIALGFVATCNAGGAAKKAKKHSVATSPKWRPVLNPFFCDRDVVVLPDNDDAGRDHARAVVENLLPVARSVRLVELPGLPPKGDVSDWLAAGGTTEQLHALVAASKPFVAEPPPKDPHVDDSELRRLASLPLVEYGRQRIPAAKKLGCPVALLDRAVEAERGVSAASGGQGRAIELHEHQPWPEPVDGSGLLGAISAEIRHYVVMGAAEADAVALWVTAAHGFDTFYIFPRLSVKAPEKQCGKTTLLDVIGCLVPRKLSTESITPAATYRTIEAFRPTLLLDEVDTFLKDNEEMRGVMNSGHRRDGAVIRVVGDNNEPRRFSTWSPMVLAGIGRLHGTIEDRSINIGLKRRRQDEPVESFRADRPNGFGKLARMAARWVADNVADFGDLDPLMPPGVINRTADNWRPLLTVADLAGGEWPVQARAAATKLIGTSDIQSTAEKLLADVCAAFEDRGTDRLACEDLVTYLVSLDDRPWSEYNQRDRKPITKGQVGRLLGKLDIESKPVRLDDGRNKRGYTRESLDDAVARYLPSGNVTVSQPAETLGSQAHSEMSQGNSCDISGSAQNPSVSAPCDSVTFPEPLFWANDDDLEERAAILEYEAGLSRDEAERAAGLSP